MSQQVSSDKLFVKNMLTKWYRIPEYQRPYVWEKDQIIELLDDIMQARDTNPKSEYFLGSLVLKKSQKTDEDGTEYEEYDVLDGQQRLTTLFLITAVIRDLTKNKSRKDTCIKSIFQESNPDDGVPERLRIVFDIREEVKEFVNIFVKEENGTKKEGELNQYVKNKKSDVSVKNMAQAILTIRDYFTKEENRIDDFFPYLRSNVLIIYVATEELDDAFRLFTVLNNRGVKLRNSDILKADNLAKIPQNKISEYAKKWEEVENYFGEDFDIFLSHLRTILVKQKAGMSLLKEFENNIYHPSVYNKTNKTKKQLPPILEKGEQTFEFIHRYKNNYEKIVDLQDIELNENNQIYNHIQIMKKGFGADLWVAPLLRYFDKFKTNQLIQFIQLLENKFANDWIVGYTPTKRIENINNIIQQIDDINDVEILLKNSCFDIDTADLTVALENNVYGKRYARYIMLRLDLLHYDDHTTKMNLPETISIEHILPQNPKKDSQWCRDFNDEERESWTNKIGNLVLISRRKNSSQGNKDYCVKREKYFKKNIELFTNSIRVHSNFQSWTLSELETNHEYVLNKLKNSFGITAESEKNLD